MARLKMICTRQGIEYFLDGRPATKAQVDEAFPPRLDEFSAPALVGCGEKWRRGVESNAMGVHPSQRQEAMAEAERVGVPTHFNEKGNPVFHDRGHWKRYMKAHNFVDLDSYG